MPQVRKEVLRVCSAPWGILQALFLGHRMYLVYFSIRVTASRGCWRTSLLGARNVYVDSNIFISPLIYDRLSKGYQFQTDTRFRREGRGHSKVILEEGKSALQVAEASDQAWSPWQGRSITPLSRI